MKDFLKKVFYSDNRAGNKFARLTLVLALLWLLPGVLLFCTVPPLPGMAPLIVLASALFMLIPYDFERTEKGQKQNRKSVLELLIVALIGLLLVLRLPFVWCAAGLLTVMLLAFLLSACRKWFFIRWLCICAAVVCFAGAMEAGSVSVDCISGTGWTPDHPPALIGPEWFPALVAVGTVLLIAGYLVTALYYARSAQLPFGKIFSPACRIVLGIWVAAYLLSLGMALAENHRTKKAIVSLEKQFGRPLTADSLKAIYLQDRKPDAAFWPEVKSCLDQICPEGTPIGPDLLIAGTPEGVYPEETRINFKTFFEHSEPIRKLEKLFDRKLPARDHLMEPGRLANIRLTELNWCRDFCRKELWRVRFSIENGDLPAAHAALERMKNAAKYLGTGSPMIICNIVMFSCENYRLRGLELLLADGRVPDKVLKRWIVELEQAEKALPGIVFDAQYAETVLMNDSIDGIFNGKAVLADGTNSVSLYPLRWLYPPLWYYFERDRRQLLHFMGQKWDAPHPRGDGILSRYWEPAVEAWANHFNKQTARYRAMRALIGVELEKRRTGKYPDKLENPPIDPFTGRPMRYLKGTIPISEPVWDAKKKRFEENKVRTAEGIAIWSLGANGKDDRGLDRYGGGPKGADDVRAKMIFKKRVRE